MKRIYNDFESKSNARSYFKRFTEQDTSTYTIKLQTRTSTSTNTIQTSDLPQKKDIAKDQRRNRSSRSHSKAGRHMN